MTLPGWPLFDLVLETPRLVLRSPTDADLPGLLAAIDAGVHDPAYMPFSHPWTDVEPAARRRSAVQFWWKARAMWSADDWSLQLAVFLDGRAIGVQEIMGKDFSVLKEVSTGSWLALSEQGQGFGKEMRTAVLALGFQGLGAEIARSGAFEDNARSRGVSRALGYRENGTVCHVRRGEPATVVNLEMAKQEWRENVAARYPTKISGLEPCLDMFGVAPSYPLSGHPAD